MKRDIPSINNNSFTFPLNSRDFLTTETHDWVENGWEKRYRANYYSNQSCQAKQLIFYMKEELANDLHAS